MGVAKSERSASFSEHEGFYGSPLPHGRGRCAWPVYSFTQSHHPHPYPSPQGGGKNGAHLPVSLLSRYTVRMTDGLILHPDHKTRCWWPGTDPFYVAYHDTEWGVPEFDDRALFEKLILDGFQAGPVLDHHPAQARELPPGLRGLRSGGDRPLRPGAGRGADARHRHRAQPRQDRGDDCGRARLARHPGARRLLALPVGFRRRPAGPDQPRKPRGRADRKPRSRGRISKALKAEGFNFVGPTIVYAFMQAVGMVNDHLTGCFRHAECAALAEKPLMAKEPRVWQRMLSGRRLNLLDPSPLDVELDDIAHGLARVARWNGQTVGGHIFSVAQHSLLVEAIADHLDPEMSRELASRGAAARCARIRDRRHHLAVQGGDRRCLQGHRGGPARRHPPPFRPAGRSPPPRSSASSSRPTGRRPFSRRRISPASPARRRSSIFGRPEPLPRDGADSARALAGGRGGGALSPESHGGFG